MIYFEWYNAIVLWLSNLFKSLNIHIGLIALLYDLTTGVATSFFRMLLNKNFSEFKTTPLKVDGHSIRIDHQFCWRFEFQSQVLVHADFAWRAAALGRWKFQE